jgi:hypothetical protein
VVAGFSSGFLGRIAAKEAEVQSLPVSVERRRALYFNRPLDYDDANTPLNTPYLALEFRTPPSLPTDRSALRGHHVDLFVGSGFLRAEVGVSADRIASYVAGGIAFRPGEGDRKGQLFVAFPSGDAVLRFDLVSLVAGTPATVYQPFR